MPEYDFANGFSVTTHKFKRGWARRKMSNLNGQTFIRPYLREFREMFHRGELESTKKMGAAAMLEELKSRYPDRFSLPGESEIRSAISRRFKAQKNKRGNSNEEGMEGETFDEDQVENENIAGGQPI
mmetsp:Transcript_5379/g.12949  ORF Transcript_5379/g.12949 Transcript_5379/m.12949 type:complete len:127 (+) Transcript_5379:843-1223(+)